MARPPGRGALAALTELWGAGGPQAVAAAAAAGALLALLLPVPVLIVDMLLALSLGAGAGVLLIALISDEPEKMASLPPVLVLASLARIVLCLCLSRLILVTGQGGGLSPALGELVSGADAAAGVGVLIVLAVVQLVMVSAGVGRTAEVAARFALDALPGKQMGLDTALSAGQVSSSEAQSEVRRLEQEANLYGAMDGASRFLRGEAVATVVIVALTGVGAALRALGGGADPEVVRHYAVLATGQGLVTILPALLMGAAAAVLISRAASGSTLLADVEAQALLSAWPLTVGALVLLTLGVVPGVPKVPTLVGGTALLLAAWWLARAPAAARDAEGEAFAPRDARDAQPAAGTELVIELGMGLLELLTGRQNLRGLLTRLRDEMSAALGFSLPPFAVRDALELKATEYAFAYRAATLGQGRVRPQRLLAVAQSAGATPDVGTPAELADGRRGVWVPAEEAEALGEQGYALLSPAEAIVEHLRVVVRRRAGNMFDLQRAAELLRQIEMTHPEATRAAEAAGLTAGLVSQVGRLLLEASIPLRDSLAVVEGIVEGLPQETDPEKLALNLRPRLAGMITDYLSREGRIRAVELDPELEEELAEAAYRRADGTVAALPPERAAAWVLALDQLGKEYGWGEPLAIICEARSLQPLASLCVQAQSHLIALQPAELTDAAEIEFVTRLGPHQIPVASGE